MNKCKFNNYDRRNGGKNSHGKLKLRDEGEGKGMEKMSIAKLRTQDTAAAFLFAPAGK